MNLDTLLQTVKEDLPVLRKRFQLKRLAVFGSFARGTATGASDIDILVEFDRPCGFDDFMDLKFHLEDLLGKKVDLVTSRAIRPAMKNHIEREAINVA